MSIMTPPASTSLYRYYDRHGILLYVGITSRGTRRQSEHQDKAWWPYVARQTVEHFPSRESAMAAEAAAIRAHQPPFNTQHNPGRDDMLAAYAAVRDLPAGDVLAAFHALPARRLRLTQVAGAPSLTFRTQIEDAALAAGLHLRAQATRCREHRGPFLTRVVEIRQAGPFALVVCARQRPVEWPYAEAVLRWDTKRHAAWVQSVQVAR